MGDSPKINPGDITGWPILKGETEDSGKASIQWMDFRFRMNAEVASW